MAVKLGRTEISDNIEIIIDKNQNSFSGSTLSYNKKTSTEDLKYWKIIYSLVGLDDINNKFTAGTDDWFISDDERVQEILIIRINKSFYKLYWDPNYEFTIFASMRSRVNWNDSLKLIKKDLHLVDKIGIKKFQKIQQMKKLGV